MVGEWEDIPDAREKNQLEVSQKGMQNLTGTCPEPADTITLNGEQHGVKAQYCLSEIVPFPLVQYV